MTDIDVAALRAAAEGATPGPWFTQQGAVVWESDAVLLELGCGRDPADGRYVAAANPAVVLELLDEVDALREGSDRVRREVERMRRPACWGPADNGDLMVDMSVEGYERDLDSIEALLDRPPTATERGVGRTSRRRRSDLACECCPECNHSHSANVAVSQEVAAAEGVVARVRAVAGSHDFVESVVRKTCAVGPNEEPHHTCRLAGEAAASALAVLVADNLEGPQMRDEAAIARALAAPPAPAYTPPSLRRSIDQEQP